MTDEHEKHEHNDEVFEQVKAAYMIARMRAEHLTSATSEEEFRERLSTVMEMHEEPRMDCLLTAMVDMSKGSIEPIVRAALEASTPGNPANSDTALFWTGMIVGRAIEERNVHILVKNGTIDLVDHVK